MIYIIKKITTFSVVITVMFLRLGGTPAVAINYYTNNTASSSGNGTINAPCKTIQDGIHALIPGDTLLVRGDTTGRTYSESISFSSSGTASQTLTLKGYPPEKVILTGSSGSRFNIKKDHWVIENLTFDQANLVGDFLALKCVRKEEPFYSTQQQH